MSAFSQPYYKLDFEQKGYGKMFFVKIKIKRK